MKGYKSIEKILRNAKKKKKKKKILNESCFITQSYSQHIENKSLNFLRFCVVRYCLSFSNYKKLVFFTVIKRNYLLFSFKKIVFFFNNLEGASLC